MKEINSDKQSLYELERHMLEKGVHVSSLSKEGIIEACTKSTTANDVF